MWLSKETEFKIEGTAKPEIGLCSRDSKGPVVDAAETC